jgi:pilus assembly protein Flp/PilA
LTTLIRNMQARRKRDEGASAVEYGLLVALIAVVIAATVVLLGIALNTKFQSAQTCVAADPPVAASC